MPVNLPRRPRRAGAVLVAETDHAAEEQALQALVKLKPASMYSIVNYNSYPLTLDPVAIQTNANLMFQAGLLKKPLNVRTLLFLPSAGGGG